MSEDEGADETAFVTAVAWVFVAVGGISTLASILQVVVFYALFPEPFPPSDLGDMPTVAKLMFENLPLLMVGAFVVSVALLGSAYGLLQRREWGRRLFVALMALGVVWNIGGVVLPLQMYVGGSGPFASPPDNPDVQTMLAIIVVFSAIFPLAFACVFGWLAVRFTSGDIRDEFA